MRLALISLILVLGTPAFAEKIPHIMPAPYNLDRYWEGVRGELPWQVADFVHEFAKKGMPCRAKKWSRIPVPGIPYYDIRTVTVAQEFYDWTLLDRSLTTCTILFTFRLLCFQDETVVRVGQMTITAVVTAYADYVVVERWEGAIGENGHVTDLMACCRVHD